MQTLELYFNASRTLSTFTFDVNCNHSHAERIHGSSLKKLPWNKIDLNRPICVDMYCKIYFTDEDSSWLRVGSVQLSPFPGNAGWKVLNSAQIYREYRGKGYGTMLYSIISKILEPTKVSTLCCTFTDQNKAQRRIMSKLGWEIVYNNLNTHSSNIVYTAFHSVNKVQAGAAPWE